MNLLWIIGFEIDKIGNVRDALVENCVRYWNLSKGKRTVEWSCGSVRIERRSKVGHLPSATTIWLAATSLFADSMVGSISDKTLAKSINTQV